MRLFCCALLMCLSFAHLAHAQSTITPLNSDLRQQAQPLSKSLRIPLAGRLDPTKTGIALVAVSSGTTAMPLQGWQYCIAPADETLPFPALDVTWPDGLAQGDLDLTFAVWDQIGAGSGTCEAPTPARVPECTATTCQTQTFQISLGTTKPLLHFPGSRTRTLSFDDKGMLIPVNIPAIPTPWLANSDTLHLRIVEESHDLAPGQQRFDICIERPDGVPAGLLVKSTVPHIPVGTTTLTAHLWAGQSAPKGGCASDDTRADPLYDPAACTADATGNAGSCQEVTLSLSRASATLKAPAEPTYLEITVLPFLDRLISHRELENDHWATELSLTEPQNVVQLDGALRAQLKDAHGGASGGTVRLDAKNGNVLSGAQLTPFNIVLDPPASYGVFDANVQLTGAAGTMETVTLPIKVVMKMPWYALGLAIFLGVLVGWFYRRLTETHVPLAEARSKARVVIDIWVRQASLTEDAPLKQALTRQAFKLSSSYHNDQTEAKDLNALLESTRLEVQTAVQDHANRLEFLRPQLATWRKALRLDGVLPEPLKVRVKSLGDDLTEIKRLLDQENADAAQRLYDSAMKRNAETLSASKVWMNSNLTPLPKLITQLGEYCELTGVGDLVRKAAETAKDTKGDDPAAFTDFLNKIAWLYHVYRTVPLNIDMLVVDLEFLRETEDLWHVPSSLVDLIRDIKSARRDGYDQISLQASLAKLGAQLPKFLNTPENWEKFEALTPADLSIPNPSSATDVGAIFSVLKVMLAAETKEEKKKLASDPMLGEPLFTDEPSQNGYFMRRPATVFFGETGTWSVMAEEEFEEPKDVRWLVNGQPIDETGPKVSLPQGQQERLEVEAILTLDAKGKTVSLKKTVNVQGLKGWSDSGAIANRLRTLRCRQTILTGAIFVLFGTLALTSETMGYATLMTGFFLGLGADLSVNSLALLKEKAMQA